MLLLGGEGWRERAPPARSDGKVELTGSQTVCVVCPRRNKPRAFFSFSGQAGKTAIGIRYASYSFLVAHDESGATEHCPDLPASLSQPRSIADGLGIPIVDPQTRNARATESS